MPQTSVIVRASVYCDGDSFERLQTIAKQWLDLRAAHQSNLVNEAEAAQQNKMTAAASLSDRRRGTWEVANDDDADRLRRLVAAWPYLRASKQSELIEYSKLVRGESN